MKINKSLNIDLNIISPQKHIRIHEGDVDSVDILIGVTVDDESVDLSGVTIKYDATINNYLAEQDADGSVVENKISIPVTQNMTAMSGLLLIDVRMIQSDQILFTQTICATVEKAVVNDSTYIDFDKVTIIQRMNALEEKMDYIEELVENFDTSKLIVSTNRPPMGAPVEVDVDLLRVGDTWILSGDNIVYKLVEAQYNYSPAPGVEPRHSFIWQPLNERYGVDNTEPPTTVTYQAVVYTINEVQWSWLPVPEYFKGDHYLMQIGIDDPTYYICKSASMPNTGVCTYTWREEGGAGDVSNKMDLAPLNPTAQEIEAMPSGQLYGDTVNHKGIIKGGQEFYDAEYIDENYRKTYISSSYRPPIITLGTTPKFSEGDKWVYKVFDRANRCSYTLVNHDIDSVKGRVYYFWEPDTNAYRAGDYMPITQIFTQRTTEGETWYETPSISVGDVVIKKTNNKITAYYICIDTYFTYSKDGYETRYMEISVPENYYTKTEIDSMIPTVPTNISAFTNDSGYLTLETLPIYDGTVI